MAHQFALVGRVVVDLPDLPDLPFVVAVLVGAEDAAQGFDGRKLLRLLVIFLKLNKQSLTMRALFSCLEVARVKQDVLVSTCAPFSSVFSTRLLKGLMN